MTFVRLEDLPAVIRRDLARLERKAKKALGRTAKRGADHIKDHTVPTASGYQQTLVYGIPTADGARILAAGPYAAALEVGSRPHVPPLEPIIKWVKLRGMQGLKRNGKLVPYPKTSPGKITEAEHSRLQARLVAEQIRARSKRNVTPIDAAEEIAREIQSAIMKSGTAPTWFVRRSLPDVMKFLDEEMKQAFT